MSELTPITRVESYLDAIVNSGTPPLEDITRIETFLQAIYDNQVCALTPVTRIEMFLGKISGQNIVLPEPITRIELYLAAIAGEDVELPENPITRLEMYLAEWADSGDWTTISGAIVEFITQRAHKLKSCVVSLEPQQDLHGYDSPWPAGGGKNKFDASSAVDGIWESNGSYNPVSTYKTIYCKVKPNTVYTISGCGPWDNLRLCYFNNDNPTTFTRRQTMEGAPKTFTTDADTIMISFSPATTGYGDGSGVQVEEGSAATAWTPYENICPISGWTGCEVWDAKDIIGYLFNVPFEQGAINGASGNNPQPYAYYKTNNNYRIRCVDLVYLPRGNEYYVSFNSEVYDVVIQPYNESGFSIEPVLSPFGEWRTSPFSFVSTGSVAIAIRRKDGNLIAVSELPDINFGEKTSYSVTWEDEVYGAEPDVVSGEMPVTWAIVDLADETWRSSWFNTLTNTTGVYRFAVNIPNLDIKLPPSTSVKAEIICDRYKTVTADDTYLRHDGIGVNSSSKRIQVFDSNYNDVSDFLASLDHLYVCYKLATPIPIAITPTPITALKGYNAVWSDAGDVTVTVRGEPVVEPDVQPLQALNLLLGGAYHNNQTAEDVSDDEALDIILGGEQR